MRRRRPIQNGIRVRAIALAFLIVLGGLLETVHRAQVRHAICPEHGELVHADVGHGFAQVDPIAHDEHGACAAESARGETLASRHSHDTDDHGPSVTSTRHAELVHEHCVFEALLRTSASVWSDVRGGYHVPLGVVVHRADVPEIPPVSLPVLSFAPKHSPPARAA